MKRTKQGFSLIELLVVIAIIGLLSTLSIISLNSARAKARDAKRISDVKQMQVALELYYNEVNDYPDTTSVTPGAAIATGTNTFLRSVPTPPSPADGPICNTDVAGTYSKTSYLYSKTGASYGIGSSTPSYTISFCLGGTIGQGAAAVVGNQIRTITPAGIY